MKCCGPNLISTYFSVVTENLISTYSVQRCRATNEQYFIYLGVSGVQAVSWEHYVVFVESYNCGRKVSSKAFLHWFLEPSLTLWSRVCGVFCVPQLLLLPVKKGSLTGVKSLHHFAWKHLNALTCKFSYAIPGCWTIWRIIRWKHWSMQWTIWEQLPISSMTFLDSRLQKFQQRSFELPQWLRYSSQFCDSRFHSWTSGFFNSTSLKCSFSGVVEF